jgi:hypothetical protein
MNPHVILILVAIIIMLATFLAADRSCSKVFAARAASTGPTQRPRPRHPERSRRRSAASSRF